MYKEYYSPNWLWVVGRGWFCNLYCPLPPPHPHPNQPPLLLIVPSPLPLCPGSYKSPLAVVHFFQTGVLFSNLFPASS